MEPVKVAAMLEKVTTLKDGSIRCTFDTQELPHEKCADLLSMRNNLGWLIFCPTSTDQIEIPDEPPTEFKNEKTPSQRLRSVLYVWWEQAGKQGSFDEFYRTKIEYFISRVKEKLDREAA